MVHGLPNDEAEALNTDSHRARTGVDPRTLSAGFPHEDGIEAVVGDDRNLPSSMVQNAETTRRVAHERAADETVGGQG